MTRFPPPPPGAERRAEPRHDVLVAVEVAHDDSLALASLVNVSMGGAFVALADVEALAVGVRVRVQLALGGRKVTAAAKVVRVTPAGIALAWSAPRGSLAAMIEHLLATAPPPVATAAVAASG